MLLHAARFPARVDSDGTLFLLRDQDRRQWDRVLIAEGMRALDRASAGDAVSAVPPRSRHRRLPRRRGDRGTTTDWPQIVELYDELLALTGRRWWR